VKAQNRYAEAKFVSDFDGPHNFILGANYMEQESIDRFLTASSPLTMLAGAASYYLPTFGPSVPNFPCKRLEYSVSITTKLMTI
jgi:hypothetical protein